MIHKFAKKYISYKMIKSEILLRPKLLKRQLHIIKAKLPQNYFFVCDTATCVIKTMIILFCFSNLYHIQIDVYVHVHIACI